MKYDINELSSKLNKVDKELKEIEVEEKIKKYGTFLDSKKEIIQLYVLLLIYLRSTIVLYFSQVFYLLFSSYFFSNY